MRGERDGSSVEFRARFVVDATGPRGFLHRALGLREIPLPDYPATQSLYSHFSGVGRLGESGLQPHRRRSRLIRSMTPRFITSSTADGSGFSNSTTESPARALRRRMSSRRSWAFKKAHAAWQRLLDRIPALKAQFANARAERPFTHMPRLAFRSSAIAGERWALLPSAAGFVDPLLSTGFPLTLLGVTRVAEIIESAWGSDQFRSAASRIRTTNRSGIAGHGAAHRSALREHESIRCVCRANAALLRGGKLCRVGAKAPEAATRAVVSSLHASGSSAQLSRKSAHEHA